MRYSSKKVFPHPVLRPGSDDYRGRKFHFNSEETSESEGIRFSFEFGISDPALLELLQEKKAAYAVLIKSISTNFRRLVSQSDASCFECLVEEGMLGGRVEISPYVVACVDITGFTSPHIHPEFPERTFDFRAGTVLAIGEAKAIYVEDATPLGSVFDIQGSKDVSDETCCFHRDEDHVVISVSEADYARLVSMRKTTEGQAMLLQALYLPVITSLLYELDKEAKEGRVDYGLKWVRAFLDKLEKAKLPKPGDDNVESRFSDAQSLLGYPQGKFLQVSENRFFHND